MPESGVDMEKIEMFLPIEPRGQARARHMVTKRGVGITYKSGKERLAENKLAALMVEAAKGKRIDGPIRLQVVAYIPIPNSFSKAKKSAVGRGELWPEKKPDLDNIVKHVLDVSQGLLFDDDKSICQIVASKAYGAKTGYSITFEKINSRSE